MEMKRTRIEYIDTAKAYLILLVILGHVLIVLNPGYDRRALTVAQAFIYTFHMPAFFIIHGMLFREERWESVSLSTFVGKRARSLIIPYFFFEGIGIIWKRLFAGQSFAVGVWNCLTVRCNVGADWFLPAMFIGSLGMFLAVRYLGRTGRILLMILCLVLPIFMSGHQLLIVLGRGLLACGFVMIGLLGKRWFMSERVKKLSTLALMTGVTGVVAIVGLKWAGNDFYSCTVGNPVTFALGGSSGALLILGISRRLSCAPVKVIGRHTLTIMGTHQLVIYAMTAWRPGLYGGSVATGAILLVAILVFEIPVVWFIDRYLPGCVGRG